MAEIVWTHEAVQWLEEISGHGRHIALGFGADGLAIAQERGELHVAQHDWNEGLVGIRPGALQRHAPVSMEERFARRVGPDQKHYGIGLVDRVLDCFGPVFAWSKKPDRIDRLDAEARERFAQAPCGSCAVAAVGEVGLHWGAVSWGLSRYGWVAVAGEFALRAPGFRMPLRGSGMTVGVVVSGGVLVELSPSPLPSPARGERVLRPLTPSSPRSGE